MNNLNVLDSFFEIMNNEELTAYETLYKDYLRRTTSDFNFTTGKNYTANELSKLHDMCNRNLKSIEMCRATKKINSTSEFAESQPKNSYDDWFEIEKVKPPHEVVLAACYTYDCGWSMDTAWWNTDDNCWMLSGCVTSQKAHLPYTHWRKLPPPPKNI